jgi:hypothetical protein
VRVNYAGSFLAPGGLEGTRGISFNGSFVLDEAQFFRAAAMSFFSRGNRSTGIGFSVSRNFASESDALIFASIEQNTLPGQGDLFVSDEEGTTVVALEAAVLEGVSVGPLIGSSVEVSYQFRGGVFVPSVLPPQPTDTVITGNIALALGDESKAVVFPAPFAVIPTSVDCWVVCDSAAPVRFIDAAVLRDTITTTGFTAGIGFPIPSNGQYWLYWQAI